MKLNQLLGMAALLLFAAVSVASPCVAIGTSRGGPLMFSWIDAKGCGAARVYVSNFHGPSGVQIFPQEGQSQKPCGYLSGRSGIHYANKIFVDQHENLWVANGYDYNILEFAKNATQPKRILQDPAGEPYSVVFDEKAGALYVGNVYDQSHSISIQVYARGHDRPSRELSLPSNVVPYSLAIDNEGNLYMMAPYPYPPDGVGVFEWYEGEGPMRDLGIFGGFSSAGIHTTSSGSLTLCSAFSFNQVYKSCWLVPPGFTMPVDDIVTNQVEVFDSTITADEKKLFLVQPSQVSEYLWPGSRFTAPINQFSTNPDVEGIAVSPAAPPGRPYLSAVAPRRF
ncbi:MAG: hypothetical protein JO043_12235 [Candidatus Eremiobacteraeota bacterium]|nr:hypothetical protein [Candidatus Eremiobacteraeota bacterium]